MLVDDVSFKVVDWLQVAFSLLSVNANIIDNATTATVKIKQRQINIINFVLHFIS